MSELDDAFVTMFSETQGRLFELSGVAGFDSMDFIQKFMSSEVCRLFDTHIDHICCAGEKYIMECLQDEFKAFKQENAEVFSNETLYWIGYVYRYWQCKSQIPSSEIYSIAVAQKMYMSFPAYHCLAVENAISRLKEK